METRLWANGKYTRVEKRDSEYCDSSSSNSSSHDSKFRSCLNSDSKPLCKPVTEPPCQRANCRVYRLKFSKEVATSGSITDKSRVDETVVEGFCDDFQLEHQMTSLLYVMLTTSSSL